MSSAAIYHALIAFLDGDSGDVRSAINAEQPSLLAAGSVGTSRAPRNKAGTRRLNAPPVCVEIVPRGESPSKVVGIGIEELVHVLDLECNVRRKSIATGKSQLDSVENMTRALIRRYRGVSNLAIDLAGTGVYFLRSDAMRVEVDQIPEASERIRAVVRVSFTFLESQALNADA